MNDSVAAELITAVLALTAEIKRYNDENPSQHATRHVKGEAEYGIAKYEDREKRETQEAMRAHFGLPDEPDSAGAIISRRGQPQPEGRRPQAPRSRRGKPKRSR